ncbi:uncharacterized protein FOMMEDRAFT_141122 [Fomitiporia mediterranea MF3/22]|uniref:uncharacterized protein n=1 Tax=Fomitiporia mediterranea (strain MF3/22) TaxID=694068 RepID=UPI0004408FEF|nr:uncharacterized protein FOMMEDRAFT_141122 [Fomitiporia mediterranea MF3/22]EJD01890.1 hypothetical protein FOMMEDRAFT_141122 [Fomitiporia mediterranea MF3/22]
MLLRLVPEPPLPTILFTLAFGNLPDGVPFPPSWTAQLQHILHDELELPQCIHALDKAVWAACLLHEVTFSVAAQSVSVIFVDGTSTEWPLADEKLEKALREVMEDVGESSVAAEMEQRRAQAIQVAAEAQAAQERMPASPSAPPAKGKHKKSRSLLMSLVASFVPSHIPPAALPSLVPPRSIAPLELAPPPPEPPQSSRYLRRKARAALVDIYRRYVLLALASDSPLSVCKSNTEGVSAANYVLWNLHSILKRIEGRMHLLGVELGSSSSESSVKTYNSHQGPRKLRTSPSALSESPFDEEEETSSATGTAESTSDSADTEASSVSAHTPRDVLPAYPLLCTSSSQEKENAAIENEGGIVRPASPLTVPSSAPSPLQPRSRPQSRRLTRRPAPPPQNLQQRAQPTQQQAQQHEYALLHASTVRLRALISRNSSFTLAQGEERSAVLATLERKSRRRAWSCRQLMGAANVDVGLREGLNMPMRGSGLRWSWVVSVEGENIHAHGRVGVPRTPRRRDAGLPAPGQMRISRTISVPVLASAFVVPSQAGCVPFPQTESVEDFCSTGPQDTSRLFGGGEESESEDSEAEIFEPQNAGGMAPYACSRSSDDLPSLFSSLSTSSSTSLLPSPNSSDVDPEFEDVEFGHASQPSSMHAFKEGDAFEPPCDASAPALCFEEACKCRHVTPSRESIGVGRGKGIVPSLIMHARRKTFAR